MRERAARSGGPLLPPTGAEEWYVSAREGETDPEKGPVDLFPVEPTDA